LGGFCFVRRHSAFRALAGTGGDTKAGDMLLFSYMVEIDFGGTIRELSALVIRHEEGGVSSTIGTSHDEPF
jgi:hypothetical protein